MEQINLVCSPDGKTWDEVTRDTSYIGNVVCKMATDTGTDWSTTVTFDEWRGVNGGRNWFNKYFAIAYDRIICLETGAYKFIAQNYPDSTGSYMAWLKSGTNGAYLYTDTKSQNTLIQIFHCNRGDYIQLRGEFGNGSLTYNYVNVEKLS